MKKLLSISLAIVLLISTIIALPSCNKENQKYTVGICQYVQHPALDEATRGFKQALIDKLGQDKVDFIEQNAAEDTNACTTIVQSFVSKNVDLIMANATPALAAAYNATNTIPILGTSVTEYGTALGIKDFNGTVGGNVSGTSDLASLNEQAQMIIDLFPNATKVGILYCSAEDNSKYQVDQVEKYLTEKNITVTKYPFSDNNDIAAITTTCADNNDVIYIPTDNKAASCAETIGNIVIQKKIPVVAGEEGICKSCGVTTLSISYYDLGYKTGEMAAKILTGESKVGEMPIEYAPATKKYNKTICDAIGMTIPEGYEKIGD